MAAQDVLANPVPAAGDSAADISGGADSQSNHVPAAEPIIPELRSFSVPSTFSLRAVDPTSADPGVPGDDFADPVGPVFGTLNDPHDPEVLPTTSSEKEPVDEGTLGALDDFKGTFIGNGLNIIFRPRNEVVDPTQDNLLEINVTKEKLQFMSRDVLGAIPNRGFGFKAGTTFASRPSQPDVILRGIPYQQTITDLVDQVSKTLREPGIPIHFEQGLFLRTPALTHPNIPATLSRLASIPHGTTINAQVEDPGFDWTREELKIKEQAKITNIVPFTIGNPTNLTQPFFPHLDEPDQGNRNRLPNKLREFRKFHAVDHHLDPLETLVAINKVKNIVKHRTFEFTTDREALASNGNVISGGGTSNIAFLQGSNESAGKNNTDANANAVKVTCRYWVSVVSVDLEVPPTNHDKVEITPGPLPNTEVPNGVTYVHPTFVIPLKRPLTEAVSLTVEYVQIQYAQNVTLDFGPLSWPHISVATLIPGGEYGNGKVELKPAQLPDALK